MQNLKIMEIDRFFIRAHYPNFYMIKLYAEHGRSVFYKQNEKEGNKPGTVIYTLRGSNEPHNIAPLWFDVYYLLTHSGEEQKHYLSLLIEEKDESAVVPELEDIRDCLHASLKRYYEENPLFCGDDIVPSVRETSLQETEVSNKGRMLLDLTQLCYPVPDFCILSAHSFNAVNRTEIISKALSNLEIMTRKRLGSDTDPLVFAIRSAMPQYIPGLMPTLLNVGVTRKAYHALCRKLGMETANRIYLSALHNLAGLLELSDPNPENPEKLNVCLQNEEIAVLETAIAAKPDGDRLLNDAVYQAVRLVGHVRDFYIKNQDLILTFMQGKKAYPSFILQKMVWTIGNDESYPGVLHSRHSRTGVGSQIESYRNIFGEEIMTGNVTSSDSEYFDREEIRDKFPAVYHFHPLLPKLEQRYLSPVTIEFAVESKPNEVSLFSVLQLNRSELTGRSALLSSIDLYEKGFIKPEDVVNLIRPYHLRQIISDSIDDNSFSKLKFFSKGLNVLPRTAITTVLCFNTSQAREAKRQGKAVCLCQERFIPEDTIVLNEVDAILSMEQAAIHVVTACRGYGISAFMNLREYGVVLKENSLVNADGLEIKAFDYVTLSSKRKSIYVGVADYKPARFLKYLSGQQIRLEPKEKPVFESMKVAYEKYQHIVTSTKTNYITDIDTLARLIRCDLQDKPETAEKIVNSWYETQTDNYITQLLESKMGSHSDQSRVFSFLSTENKIQFFRQACRRCFEQQRSGLKAGSFMLGRFISSQPLPKQFWKSFSEKEIAFMLNEYVLYEKYLKVLAEVGETKLTRAHAKIEDEGMHSLGIANFELTNFVPLMDISCNWKQVLVSLDTMDNVQEDSLRLIAQLSQPMEKAFDLRQPWTASKIEKLRNL